jgi:hypothetical protein
MSATTLTIDFYICYFWLDDYYLFTESGGVSTTPKASSGGGLRATAMTSLAQLVVHQHAGVFNGTDVLQRSLTADVLPTLLEGIADTRSTSLSSFLDVVNYVLLHSPGVRRDGGADGGCSIFFFFFTIYSLGLLFFFLLFRIVDIFYPILLILLTDI